MALVDYLQAEERRGEVGAFQQALTPLMEELTTPRELETQLDPTTATWGLELWEHAYGIAVEGDKSLAYRRSRLVSKMRGSGTTTAELIESVAASFSNGRVEVIEVTGEYRFVVKFVGTVGIPPNLEDLTAALDAVKPAHLGFEYEILYRTWGAVKERTWGSVAGHTWGELRGGNLDGTDGTLRAEKTSQ